MLLARVLGELDRLLTRWDAGEDLRAEYAAGCATIGRQVRLEWDVESGGSVIVQGEAVGVDAQGGLLVRDGDGVVKTYVAGDVVHLR